MYCLYIIIDLHVPVNNIRLLNVPMEVQEWVLFAVLSSYKIFYAAVNNVHVLGSSCKMSGTDV